MKKILMILPLLVTLLLLGARVFPPSDVQTESIKKKFDAEEIKYFSEVAFGYPDRIKRWDKEIKVQLIGKHSEDQKKEVLKVISEIKAIGIPIAIDLSKENGNLTVQFLSEIEFVKTTGEKPDMNGITTPVMTFFNQIKKVDIIVNEIPPKMKWETILRHEFCHALGLWKHTKSPFIKTGTMGRKIFMSIENYESYDDTPRLGELDIAALRIMYGGYISIGCTRSAFLEAMKNAK